MMLNWLDLTTPHAGISADNSIFNAEVRAMSWAHSPQQLKRYSAKMLALISGVLLGLWALWMITAPSFALQNTGNMIGVLLLISLGTNVVLNFTSVAATVNSFNAEWDAGRLDLIKITDCGLEMFIAANHAAAQVRVWKMMITVTATRSCTVILLAFRMFILPSIGFYDLIALLIFLVLSLLAVLEPLWGIRMFTAIGLDISARSPNPLIANMRGLTSLVSVWFALGVIIMGVALITLSGAVAIGTFTQNYALALFGVFLGSLLLVGVLNVYYRSETTTALKRARIRASRSN